MTIFSYIIPKFPELEEVVKLFIILSYGNAARIKSGFSISKLLRDVNMKDQSLVAQRFVYEGVVNESWPIITDINNMMKSVTQSNRRYEVEFEVNKRKQTERVKKKKKNEKKNNY